MKRVISGLIFILLQVFYYSTKITLGFLLALLGSFSNDDGDGKEDVKKAIGLLRKTTTLHVHHAFLYISLPSLLDYDVKMPVSNETPKT